jgi:hypothetical protein
VAADVRIPIENYEILPAAMNDQIIFVGSRVLTCCTEDTGWSGIFSTGGTDVGVPPGTPESFHELTLREVARLAERSLRPGFR